MTSTTRAKLHTSSSIILFTSLVICLIHNGGAQTSCPRHCTCTQSQLLCGGAVRRHRMKIIHEIPKLQGDLADHHLQIGNFSKNAITHVPKEAFRGLYSVRILDLSHNRIASVDDGAFWMESAESNLKVLYLSYNKIHDLRPGMFRGLKHLWRLYLDHNDIQFIDDRAFSFVPDLHMISFASSLQHGTYTPAPLKVLQQLKMIYLANNVQKCDCDWVRYIDAIRSLGISIPDEGDIASLCNGNELKTCGHKMQTKTELSSIPLQERLSISELTPPVNNKGFFTYEGRTYSLHTPEGKRLLMLYDMDIRRQIAEIRHISTRDHYERVFRQNMRGVVEKSFEKKELPSQPGRDHGSAILGSVPASVSQTTRYYSSPLQNTESITLSPGDDTRSTVGKTPIQYQITLASSRLHSGQVAATVSPGTKRELLLIVVISSLFVVTFILLLAYVLQATKHNYDNDDVDESGALISSPDSNGNTGCFQAIIGRLTLRKQVIADHEGKKGNFSELHKKAKMSIDARKSLSASKNRPLTEDAIRNLSTEHRRKVLGGTSRASSERSELDNDDSDDELFARY